MEIITAKRSEFGCELSTNVNAEIDKEKRDHVTGRKSQEEKTKINMQIGEIRQQITEKERDKYVNSNRGAPGKGLRVIFFSGSDAMFQPRYFDLFASTSIHNR